MREVAAQIGPAASRLARAGARAVPFAGSFALVPFHGYRVWSASRKAVLRHHRTKSMCTVPRPLHPEPVHPFSLYPGSMPLP